MTPEHKALVAELRELAAQNAGPLGKEVRPEWRAAESLSAQSAQPQAGEAVTRDAVAKALHAVDCFDADRDRQLDGLPPVDKWADPWLPTGKRQLEVLLRRADVFLSALSQPHPADERVVEALPYAWANVRVEDTGDGLIIHPDDARKWGLDNDRDYTGSFLPDGRFRIALAQEGQ